MKVSASFLLFLSIHLSANESTIPKNNLILDLDAEQGVTHDSQQRVTSWQSQALTTPRIIFQKQDKGRKEPHSGCPSFRKDATSNKKPSIVFRQQELVCAEEDFFDGLVTGDGYTWIAVIAVHPQRVGVKDVNSFFGNLRNGGKYEGIWGCLNDDNSIWIGSRNGKSFGRFDANNPQVLGPVLEPGKFHIIAGKMEAGKDQVKISLYVNSSHASQEGVFPVNPHANSSKMAIGQERDAVEHPGHESFDGEIARFLLWKGALAPQEWQEAFTNIAKQYEVLSEKNTSKK